MTKLGDTARCVIPTTDQKTGIQHYDGEPRETLVTYRPMPYGDGAPHNPLPSPLAFLTCVRRPARWADVRDVGCAAPRGGRGRDAEGWDGGGVRGARGHPRRAARHDALDAARGAWAALECNDLS